MPPRPEFHGSCVASASAVATAASIALPPASSTATPASAAPFACATTMPRRPVADGLLSCQCCVTWGDGVYCMVGSLELWADGRPTRRRWQGRRLPCAAVCPNVAATARDPMMYLNRFADTAGPLDMTQSDE